MDDRFPAYRGKMEYVCLNCGERYPIDRLLYACPACRGVFLLEDAGFFFLARAERPLWKARRPCARR